MTFISFFLYFIAFAPLYAPIDWEMMKLSSLSVGTWISLSEYWRLAYATAIGKNHKFGLLFWVAISGALGAIYLFYELQLFKAPTMVIFLGTIILSTGHFIFLQLKNGNKLCPTHHSSGTA